MGNKSHVLTLDQQTYMKQRNEFLEDTKPNELLNKKYKINCIKL